MWSSWAFCKLVHISMPTPYLSIKWSDVGRRVQAVRFFGAGFLFMRASLATHSTWYWPQTRSNRTNAVPTVPIPRNFDNAAGFFICWIRLPCSGSSPSKIRIDAPIAVIVTG